MVMSEDGSVIYTTLSNDKLKKYSTTPKGDYELYTNPATIQLNKGGSAEWVNLYAHSLNGLDKMRYSVTGVQWIGGSPSNVNVLMASASNYITNTTDGYITFNMQAFSNAQQGNYTLRFLTNSGQLEHYIDVPVEILGDPEFTFGIDVDHVRVTPPGEIHVIFNITSHGINGASYGFSQSNWVGTAPTSGVLRNVYYLNSSNIYDGETLWMDLKFDVLGNAVPGNYTYHLVATAVTGGSSPLSYRTEGPNITLEISTTTDLDHFEIDPIGTQAATLPFDIVIKAVDANGNLVEDFRTSAALVVSSGGVTVSPSTTAVFVDGETTLPVTINAQSAGVTLRAYKTIQGVTYNGYSNVFEVVAGPDFSMLANPTSVSLELGGEESSTVTLSSIFNFSGTASVSGTWVGSVPSGVTVNLPSSVSLPEGGSVDYDVTFNATTIASTGSFTYKVTSTIGAKSHSVDLILNLAPVDYNPRLATLEIWQQGLESTLSQIVGLFSVDSFFDVFVEIQNSLQGLQSQIDIIEVTPGPQGEPGPQGPEGPQGAPGQDANVSWVQEQIDGEKAARVSADNVLKTAISDNSANIDSFFDIFTQAANLFIVDSFFDVFVSIQKSLMTLEEELGAETQARIDDIKNVTDQQNLDKAYILGKLDEANAIAQAQAEMIDSMNNASKSLEEQLKELEGGDEQQDYEISNNQQQIAEIKANISALNIRGHSHGANMDCCTNSIRN
jgi:hypothetical protein